MKVVNTRDHFESTLRKFKKKITDSGLLEELRDRECYDKPSVGRKIAKQKARSRWKKHLRSHELPKKLY